MRRLSDDTIWPGALKILSQRNERAFFRAGVPGRLNVPEPLSVLAERAAR